VSVRQKEDRRGRRVVVKSEVVTKVKAWTSQRERAGDGGDSEAPGAREEAVSSVHAETAPVSAAHAAGAAGRAPWGRPPRTRTSLSFSLPSHPRDRGAIIKTD